MRERIYDVLTGIPAALLAVGGFAATVSSDAAAWISTRFVALWTTMEYPPVTAFLTLALAAYVAAIIWASRPRGTMATVPDETLRVKMQLRRELIQDGRRLVAEFNQQARIYTFLEFLKYRAEYPAIRAHLSKEFLRKFENGRYAVAADDVKDGKIYGFMDELARLEREWSII